MRHALGGKRVRPGAVPRDRRCGRRARGEPAAGRRGGRARAFVLARPRRPAGARRRPRAPRRAVGVGALRRGDRDPRRRRAARRGGPARAHLSDVRRGARADRRDARDDRRPAAGPRGRRAARPAPLAEDRRALLRLGHVRALGGRGARLRARAVARVRRRARPAVPDRRRRARRRRLRARRRRGRSPPPRGRGGGACAGAARRDRRRHERARGDRRRARRPHVHDGRAGSGRSPNATSGSSSPATTVSALGDGVAVDRTRLRRPCRSRTTRRRPSAIVLACRQVGGRGDHAGRRVSGPTGCRATSCSFVGRRGCRRSVQTRRPGSRSSPGTRRVPLLAALAVVYGLADGFVIPASQTA